MTRELEQLYERTDGSAQLSGRQQLTGVGVQAGPNHIRSLLPRGETPPGLHAPYTRLSKYRATRFGGGTGVRRSTSRRPNQSSSRVTSTLQPKARNSPSTENPLRPIKRGDPEFSQPIGAEVRDLLLFSFLLSRQSKNHSHAEP
ncbi:hypothetical protein Q5P01_009597 [Channa striata]|uniref:Uncharacterized protein n=1 Tax=Channa striata TaxID=64152 RepID=A0AA88MW66_CHASR|nr:hypothetical protein Q5P01_009597 [Channa striata]